MGEEFDAKELIKSLGPAHDPKANKPKHPPGLVPGYRFKQGGEGEVVVRVPAGQDPCWDSLLGEMGLGGQVDVLDVVEVRVWEVFSNEHGTQQMRYVKARAVKRISKEDAEDIAKMHEAILKMKPSKRKPPAYSEEGLFYVVNLADWQFGKRDSGRGTQDTLDLICAMAGRLLDHVRKLRRQKLPITRLVIAGLGDMVEGCEGWYPMQSFQVELHQRAQRKVVRRALIALLKMWAPHFAEVWVMCVGGNHGENRRNGKAFTSFADNDDVAVFEQVADACALAPDVFGHVHFQIPDEDLTVTRSLGGVTLGLAHGHQAAGSKPDNIKSWWGRCIQNGHPISTAHILVTGHFHHWRSEDRGKAHDQDYGRTWFQCPTLDGGSKWFREGGGEATVQGTLAFMIDPHHPRGWSQMEIL